MDYGVVEDRLTRSRVEPRMKRLCSSKLQGRFFTFGEAGNAIMLITFILGCLHLNLISPEKLTAWTAVAMDP
ncbi:hypothetical protein [Paenibacillus sp. GM2]|uniref:hypothetical protein n=1 Tax=Paenibacillus sp. GM2 TaxID=1622070 RepID=UPI000837B0F7|nr:hypothetical protein [Paenibacillus sp. GM2]NWL90087.1 hypothetical protein [Paenibacillus sp. 79R4]